MKFRLPFQIYRTGVISRSSSPGKILNKFSKDNEAKVRKKTSKDNSSYRAIISNYIYRFTHLPLKITMSKLRNKAKLRSSTKSHKSKIRKDFAFLQEATKNNNSSHKKTRTDRVTNEASECCMNSTKCANFMCAKSTAKILLQQKDLLCNKSSKKSVTPNPEDVKPNENKNPKNGVTNAVNGQIKDNKAIHNNPTSPPMKKIEKTIDKPINEKHKPNEYKWKFNKSEAVGSNTELRRLKRMLQSQDKNRNYKVEEAPPAPIRMDNVVGAPHFPKKLPPLPIQIMPKIEQVRPKEGPSLVAPKRKYEAPEMTRNYKTIQDVSHGPPRMDNLVAAKALPKEKTPELKGLHENYTPNSKQNSKNIHATEFKKETPKSTKYYSSQTDHKLLPKINNITEINKRNMVNEEKDTFLLKLDQVVNDLVPKTKRPTRSLQQLNASNINVSERIKKFEEIIGHNSDHRCKSEGLKSRIIEERIITQPKQSEKKDQHILSPKLSPFAIAEIRRKYYPPDTFEKERSKVTIPVNSQMAFAVPLIEKIDARTETKLKHLYYRPKEQYKNLDEKILDINPTGNIKKTHAKIRQAITCSSGVEKQKDLLTLDVDNSNSDSLGDCSTNSTIDTSTVNVISPNMMIPPPSNKVATAPENKRNYSSTAIYEYKEAFNVCSDLLHRPNINMTYSNSTATASNLGYNQAPPAVERKFSANIKKSGEINSEVARAKKRNRIESTNIPQDIEALKQDRKFSTDVLTRNNVEDRNSNNSKDLREMDRSIMMNANSNIQRTAQRNLSKRHCTIKVTSTLDNQDNTVSSTGASDKLTRKMSYQYYHEQCTISKNVNNYEINLPPSPRNEENPSTIEITADDLITDERYNKMLNEKTTLINNYIKWKMQLQKFGTPPTNCNEPSKCCLNFTNGIDKQDKYRMRKYKIIRRKQKTPSNNSIPVRQDRQTESINNTMNLLKTQVAQKCVLFDKISDALLKKSDIINYCNHANSELQQKEEYLQYNKKRKLSVVPMLDNPPKKKYVPVPEPKQQDMDIVPTPTPETKNVFEQMELDTPQLITNVAPSSANEEVSNTRKTVSRKSSCKIKGPKVPSREASRLELIHTNKNNFLQHTLKIKPPAIPATMKAKKFLAKIEAGPYQAGNMLIKKIDKKVKCQKSKTKLLSGSDKIGKYIS